MAGRMCSGPASGVQLEDDCIQQFTELQRQHKSKYIIYKLSDDSKKIVVDKVGKQDATYDSFVQELINAQQQGEGRYGIFDLDYSYKERKISKIVFFLWVPDGIKVKQRMLYSSSVKALKEKLCGIHVEMQCNDESDLAHSNLMQRCCERGYD